VAYDRGAPTHDLAKNANRHVATKTLLTHATASGASHHLAAAIL
jgi:hypothetical protein